jgi:hypothetical protein
MKKFIQLEFNEVSRPIIAEMVKQGLLPNFSKIEKSWNRFETESEADYQCLEPWIQWVTVHTGKSFSEHKIFRLGDSRQLQFKQIWELLSEKDIESICISPMNAHRGNARGGVFVPDPWAKENDTYPNDLSSLWEFISSRVQTHATRSKRKSLLDGVLLFSRVGMRWGLMFRIGIQILKQRVQPKSSWYLSCLFDEFLADLFLSTMSKKNAGFNLLFMNSVAHLQHHFWRKFEPHKFDSKVNAPDCLASENPIRRGLQLYDKILGKILDRYEGDSNVCILVATALSQVPYLEKEIEGGMNYYRLNSHQDFLNRVGLDGLKAYPLMSRDWQIECDSETSLIEAETVLAGLNIGNDFLFQVSRNSSSSLFIETKVTRKFNVDEPILNKNGHIVGIFSEVFTRVAVKSGHHSSVGYVWLNRDLRSNELKNHRSIPLATLFHLPSNYLLGS